jgi:hypothetical protein
MRHHFDRSRLVTAMGLAALLGGAAIASAGVTWGGLKTAGNFVVYPAIPLDGRCGQAVAIGDLDGDGFDDLAVGCPTSPPPPPLSGNHAGRVEVFLSQLGTFQPADQFFGSSGSSTGHALAAGDFDGDGDDELAVGQIGATVSGAAEAGQVTILDWDDAAGQLVESGSFRQGLTFLGETPEAADRFGYSLAGGDFNDDGIDDLAIGVPFENDSAAVDAGIVHVLYGFAGGLSALGSQTWSLESTALFGWALPNANFGWSVAAGDFDGDGPDDLAVGVIGAPSAAYASAGGVAVLYGTGNAGLGVAGSQLWTKGSGGLPGVGKTGDGFGWSLAAGDFDADGRDDLAVGIPGDDPLGTTDAGGVCEIHGSPTGLTGSGSRIWTPGDPALGNPYAIVNAGGDRFGSRVVSGRFDGGQTADLAIASPYANYGTTADAGAVDMMLGSSTGLRAAGAVRFYASGLVSAPVANDLFGFGLAAGDVDRDGDDDLAIGIPQRGGDSPGSFMGIVQGLRGVPTNRSSATP